MRACVECAALCINTRWRRLRLFGHRQLNTRVLHVASVHYGGVLKVLCLMFSFIFSSSILMHLLFCLFSTPVPRQLNDRTCWEACFPSNPSLFKKVVSCSLLLCCQATLSVIYSSRFTQAFHVKPLHRMCGITLIKAKYIFMNGRTLAHLQVWRQLLYLLSFHAALFKF